MTFITYRVHYGKVHAPTDWDPNTYSGIAVFNNELAALRHANKHSLTMIEIAPGDTIEEAIQKAKAR